MTTDPSFLNLEFQKFHDPPPNNYPKLFKHVFKRSSVNMLRDVLGKQELIQ